MFHLCWALVSRTSCESHQLNSSGMMPMVANDYVTVKAMLPMITLHLKLLMAAIHGGCRLPRGHELDQKLGPVDVDLGACSELHHLNAVKVTKHIGNPESPSDSGSVSQDCQLMPQAMKKTSSSSLSYTDW